MFLVGSGYGTRCTTALTIERSGELVFVERRFDPAGAPLATARFGFTLRRDSEYGKVRLEWREKKGRRGRR